MELLLAQASTAPASATAETVLFWVFAVIGIGAGIAMISLRNIVHAALMLVLNLLAIAALYLGLQSSFLGIVQVIVYAGAIMVLFLFVIMLLGVDRDDLLFETHTWHKVAAAVGGAAIAGMVLFAFSGDYTGAGSRCGAQADTTTGGSAIRCVGMDQILTDTEQGSVGVVGERLFTRYTFPFEAAALLLVVATVGAMVMGRRTDPAGDEDEQVLAPTASTGPTGDTDTVLPDDSSDPEVV